MVNLFVVLKFIVHGIMKLAGVRPQTVEIEPGTAMNFWVSSPSKESKPAVVFLHGFGLDGIITWQTQVLSLAKDYAVYVPDLLFFGKSITDRPDRSPEFQAECVARGLRKLGVEKCTIVGLSYGGMVGFKMAEFYQELVESLVVSCSVMVMTKSVNDAGVKRIGVSRWSEYLLPDTVKGVREMFKTATYKLPHLPDWIYKHYLEIMFENRKEREELLEALVISDEDFTMPNYSQKFYLLWGENDKIFPMEVATNLKKKLGDNAKLDAIEKAGHLAQIERPFVYNSLLKKFLASLEDVHQD